MPPVLPNANPERTSVEATDETLMERYCAGDEKAFEALFSRHANQVHAFLLRHTRNRALADDLLQMTWFNIHRARETFDKTERFKPWLYTIANNLRRDEGRRASRSLSDLTKDGSIPDPAVDVFESTGNSEEVEKVQAALAAISESYREVIILHRFHDLGFVEIAKMLGTTEGAVKLRAHRGYLALRQALGEKR